MVNGTFEFPGPRGFPGRDGDGPGRDVTEPTDETTDTTTAD
jgi:hypothetical protein